jgi:hypothetical protein
MRRVTALSAVAGLAVSAFAIASPAQAANDYYLIRWDNSGICQIWNDGLIQPIKWPSDYKVVSKTVPTLREALALKETLRQKGSCKH